MCGISFRFAIDGAESCLPEGDAELLNLYDRPGSECGHWQDVEALETADGLPQASVTEASTVSPVARDEERRAVAL
eukprot:s3967_g11.t1